MNRQSQHMSEDTTDIDGKTRGSRRDLLKTIGGSVAVGSALSVAGCVEGQGGNGNGNGNGNAVEFTIAGAFLPGSNELGGSQPSGIFEIADRISEADDRLNVKATGEGQICGEGDCPTRVSENVIEVAGTSMGNSTAYWPTNDIWLIPYTFPSSAAIAHTFTKEETWEKYWVPFAEEFGAIPFYSMSPHRRNVAVGIGAAENTGEIRTPDDISGLSVRRTQSSVSSIAIDNWGANPVDVTWGDTIQGLQSGTVDGAESWNPAFVAFGMAESLAEVVLNEWTIGVEVIWANVDWLKQLPDWAVEILAEETKTMHEHLAQVTQEVEVDRVGETDPPKDGTAFAENDINVHEPSDEEQKQWRSSVSGDENLELYTDILDHGETIGIDGEAFHEYLYDSARESSVPSSLSDFQVDAWWDDYLDQIER